MSPRLKSRLALEALDARDVPANLGWTNGAGTGLFDAAANWRDLSTGQTATAPPTQGDSLTFDGALSNASLTNLHGFNQTDLIADFAAINLINGYTGTVTLAADGSGGLSVGAFTLAAGAGSIAQPVGGTDLSVLGAFAWSGGTLNSTPSAATVNVYGGGSITLPTSGSLTTGSTLNFASLGGAVTTTISGAGNLLLNGTNPDGIFVRNNADVNVVASDGIENRIDTINGAKTLTLDYGSKWGYVGSGLTKTGMRVVNYGGKFFVGDPATGGRVTLTLTAGDANTPAYTNAWLPNTPWDPHLEILNGCELDAANGVRINTGTVLLVGNPLMDPTFEQTATIAGKFTMTAGVLGFLNTPTQVGQNLVWGTFRVQGDVVWSGGQYLPGVDCRAGNSTLANLWDITGTLTLGTGQPTIVPVPQLVPQGQPIPQRTWEVIKASAITGDNPNTPQGWNLLPEVENGVTKKFNVKYVGS